MLLFCGEAPSKAPEAAEAQGLTAQDLLKFKVIDKIILEPFGGAHRSPSTATQGVKEAICEALEALSTLDGINF